MRLFSPYLAVLLSFAALCVRAQRGSLVPGAYANSKTLVASELILHWSCSSETVSFLVETTSVGYVGIGFNDISKGMIGADITISTFDDSTLKATITDRMADAYAIPPLDAQQDLTDMAGSRGGGKTFYAFTRKKNTADNRDRALDASLLNLIWSLGESNTLEHHISRGVSPLQLCQQSELETSSYNNSAVLQANLTVYWSCNDTDLTVLLASTGEGYIGFGFRPDEQSGMIGSDVTISGVFDNGTVYATDRKAVAYAVPPLDAQQDLRNVAGRRTGNLTVVSFTRARNTGDANDQVLSGGVFPVLWAMGASNTIRRHVVRGVALLSLCPAASAPPTTTTTPAPPRGPAELETSSYNNSAVLQANLTVYWSCNDTDLTVLLASTGEGYIGFGFRPDEQSGMIGSDVTISGVFDNGTVYATDRKAVAYAIPPLDAQQDLRNVAGRRTGNLTVVSFTRARNTGDANDQVLSGGVFPVLWAMGASNTIRRHVVRGVALLSLCPAASTATSSSPFTTTSSSPTTSSSSSSSSFASGDSSSSSSTSASSSVSSSSSSSSTTSALSLTTNGTVSSSSSSTSTTFSASSSLASPTTATNSITSTASISTTSHSSSSTTSSTSTSSSLSAASSLSASSYSFSAALDASLKVHWNCNDTDVSFLLVRSGVGYIGFGFRSSSSAGMIGSDVIISGVQDDGTVFATDRKSTGYNIPSIDARQDLRNIVGRRSDGQTLVSFTRARNTGDANDQAITTGSFPVLWALGVSNTVEYHENRDVAVLTLCPITTTTRTTTSTSTRTTTSTTARTSTTTTTTTSTSRTTTSTTTTTTPANLALKSFVIDGSSSSIQFTFNQPIDIASLDMTKAVLYASKNPNAAFYRFTGGSVLPSRKRESIVRVGLSSQDVQGIQNTPGLGTNLQNSVLVVDSGFAQTADGRGVDPVPITSAVAAEPSSSSSFGSKSDGLSDGAVAGIVIGVLAGIALLLLITAILVRKRNTRAKRHKFAGAAKFTNSSNEDWEVAETSSKARQPSAVELLPPRYESPTKDPSPQEYDFVEDTRPSTPQHVYETPYSDASRKAAFSNESDV